MRATPSLSSGFHPQSNGQTERKNQDLPSASLCCMASQDPSSWSSLLACVEFAHNSLPSSATGLSSFQCFYDYQPPLFPSLNNDVSCPSTVAYICRCRRMWAQARATLQQSVGHHSTQANLPAGLILYLGLASAGGIQKFGTKVCGALCHPEGHQPICC